MDSDNPVVAVLVSVARADETLTYWSVSPGDANRLELIVCEENAAVGLPRCVLDAKLLERKGFTVSIPGAVEG